MRFVGEFGHIPVARKKMGTVLVCSDAISAASKSSIVVSCGDDAHALMFLDGIDSVGNPYISVVIYMGDE